MHFFLLFIQTKFVVIFSFIWNLISIFPIFFKLLVIYDIKTKKLYFCILLFYKLKILSGYIVPRESGGVYLHLKNKAIIIDFKDLIIVENDIKFFRQIGILELNVAYNISQTNLEYLYYCSFISMLSNKLLKAYKNSKFKFNYKTRINYSLKDEQFNNLIMSISFVTNIFGIINEIFANYINKGVKNVKKVFE